MIKYISKKIILHLCTSLIHGLRRLKLFHSYTSIAFSIEKASCYINNLFIINIINYDINKYLILFFIIWYVSNNFK